MSLHEAMAAEGVQRGRPLPPAGVELLGDVDSGFCVEGQNLSAKG